MVAGYPASRARNNFIFIFFEDIKKIRLEHTNNSQIFFFFSIKSKTESLIAPRPQEHF